MKTRRFLGIGFLLSAGVIAMACSSNTTINNNDGDDDGGMAGSGGSGGSGGDMSTGGSAGSSGGAAGSAGSAGAAGSAGSAGAAGAAGSAGAAGAAGSAGSAGAAGAAGAPMCIGNSLEDPGFTGDCQALRDWDADCSGAPPPHFDTCERLGAKGRPGTHEAVYNCMDAIQGTLDVCADAFFDAVNQCITDNFANSCIWRATIEDCTTLASLTCSDTSDTDITADECDSTLAGFNLGEARNILDCAGGPCVGAFTDCAFTPATNNMCLEDTLADSGFSGSCSDLAGFGTTCTDDSLAPESITLCNRLDSSGIGRPAVFENYFNCANAIAGTDPCDGTFEGEAVTCALDAIAEGCQWPRFFDDCATLAGGACGSGAVVTEDECNTTLAGFTAAGAQSVLDCVATAGDACADTVLGCAFP